MNVNALIVIHETPPNRRPGQQLGYSSVPVLDDYGIAKMLGIFGKVFSDPGISRLGEEIKEEN
jgi:hypothetical protein